MGLTKPERQDGEWREATKWEKTHTQRERDGVKGRVYG